MTQTAAPKGAGFLKVVGILMIIFGAIALIVGIIAVLGVAAIVAAAKSLDTSIESLGVSSTFLYVGSIFTLLSAVAELVTGIVGCANCKKPEKATACMVWGIIVAVFCVAGQVVSVLGGGNFSVFSLLLGLVLPVLFIIGAAKNKK